jgi:hypothetical protein
MSPLVAAVVALALPVVAVEAALIVALSSTPSGNARPPWAVVALAAFDVLLVPSFLACFALVSLGLYSLLVRP